MPKPLDLQKAVEEDINVTDPENGRGTASTTRTPADLPPPTRPQAPAAEDTAPDDTPRPRRRSTKASAAPEATGQARQTHVSLPASVVAAADSDERSRSNVVRYAVNRYGSDAVAAFQAAAPPLPGPMLVNRPQRRVAAKDDPFVTVSIRLLPSELEALDALAAEANATRSALITEVLERELNLISAQ